MADDNDLVEYGEAADIGANDTTYAIAKNFFNFEGIGPIDSDVVVVDEVELFVVTASKSCYRFWEESSDQRHVQPDLCFFRSYGISGQFNCWRNESS